MRLQDCVLRDVPPAAAGARGRASTARTALGELPEWNLGDLYPSMDAPELKSDLERALADAVAFEQRWKGTLAAEAARREEGRLGEALRENG